MKTSRSLAATVAVALSLVTPASAWAGHLLDDSHKDDKGTAPAAATPAGVPVVPTPASGRPTATPTPPVATPAPGNGNAAGNPGQDPAGDPGAAEPVLPPAASPVAGERVAATPAAGVVTVKLPGTDTYVPLDRAAGMPVGSRIDARNGTVVLHAALPGVGTEAGRFSGGEFIVRQDTRHHITELRLIGGDFGKCAERTLASTHRSSNKRVVRSLWGSDHGGHFRTHGHNSVATVRGTKWLTEDRCDGTLTKVTQGAVSVYDRRAHRTVVVKAGHSYLARRHPR